ncbi:MAG: ArsR family transcriptional regulator, partial [Anaerolineae bacterium]|nr:ArsR family transcriptional regulator [Anaerolineae bacterium]
MDHPLEQEVNLLHAQVCQGLADPKRILLLYALADGPQRVTDLAETIDVPQPTASHHLKILRER